MEFWRHLRAVLLLPTMVTVVVPALVVLFTETHVGWGLPGAAVALPIALGGALVVVGLGLLAWTVGLFRSVGQGTLAPWDPTRRLVVQGVYRHVRNPMITGVLLVLLGEAALLGSWPLLAWAGAFFLTNALYIPLVEERGLKRRFGEEYASYRRGVPRWLPRLRAWRE